MGYAFGAGLAQEVQSFRVNPERGHSPINQSQPSGEAKPRRTSGGKAVATILFWGKAPVVRCNAENIRIVNHVGNH